MKFAPFIICSFIFFLKDHHLFAQAVVLDSSNLPIIIIDTYGQQIVDDPRITVHIGIIDNENGKMNHVTDSFNNYNGEVTIEIRGSTSQYNPKKSYAFTPVDSAGEKINVQILGLPEENDWVLYAPYTDKALVRNTLAYHLFSQMNHYASRTRFAEMIINNSYKGIYELHEKIKRDKNRVDIAKLTEIDTLGDEITGGFIIKIDKTTGSGEVTWDSQFDDEVFFQFHDPDEDELQESQKNYIRNYIDSFEISLKSDQFADPVIGFRKLAAENTFIDFMIMEELGRTVDGYRSSTFLYKDKDSKGGKLSMGPLWDFNYSFGNANYCNAELISGWQYLFNDVCDNFYPHVPFWWKRLFEDTLFANNARCRWLSLRENVLQPDSINKFIDDQVSLLAEAQVRNFKKWNILNGTYTDEIIYLKEWIKGRADWIDNNLPGNCLATGFEILALKDKAVLIYPNPFSVSTTVYVSKEGSSEKRLVVYDSYGIKRKEIFFNGNETVIIAKDFSPGIYFVDVFAAEKVLGKMKMVVAGR